jgi:hypothetical protein
MSNEIDFSRFPPEVRAQLRTVQFGLDVAAFIETNVGQYLIGRAEQEREAALEELALADAADVNHIRELQLVVRRADSFGQWLADAQFAGEAADQELQQREGE